MLAALDVHHPLAFFGPCAFIGLGNGLTMPSANAGALSVRPELAGSAAGLASATTLAGGAVIAAISGVFMSEASTVFSVLGIMTATSTLSLITAIFIQIEDRKNPAA